GHRGRYNVWEHHENGRGEMMSAGIASGELGSRMRIIVAGAAAWSDAEAIRRELAKLPPGSTIVHGDSTGADAIAGQVAAALGLVVEAWRKEKADYQRYQRGAWRGLNERMLASGAVLVLAFHSAIESSRGTKHLSELAQAAGVEVRVFVE